MTLQTLAPFAPLIALLYALFALVQALRHKREGIVAILLAVLGIAAPVIAYVLSSDATARTSLVTALSISAAAVFIVSLLVIRIERKHEKHIPNRSYGMLGLGLSILLAVGMFGLPLVAPSATSTDTLPAFANATSANGDTVLVSANSNLPFNSDTTTTDEQAQATETTDSEPPEVALVLEAQTGLSADEIVTQTQAGSTLADLISANNGDLNAVITAIAAALDDLVSAGGMQAQMINQMGSDTTEIASQLVQGTLGQAQQFLLPQLITGAMPAPPNGQDGNSGSFAPPGDGSNPPQGGMPEATEAISADTADLAQIQPSSTPEVEQPATLVQATEEAPSATVVPTEAVIRPTRIVFPTATPTPDATEISPVEAETSNVNDAAATCMLTINYNLNLRNQPTTEDSTVYLSIPYGSAVTTDAVTADGWYRVTYEEQTGWISGDYVTPGTSCAALPVIH